MLNHDSWFKIIIDNWKSRIIFEIPNFDWWGIPVLPCKWWRAKSRDCQMTIQGTFSGYGLSSSLTLSASIRSLRFWTCWFLSKMTSQKSNSFWQHLGFQITFCALLFGNDGNDYSCANGRCARNSILVQETVFLCKCATCTSTVCTRISMGRNMLILVQTVCTRITVDVQSSAASINCESRIGIQVNWQI